MLQSGPRPTRRAALTALLGLVLLVATACAAPASARPGIPPLPPPTPTVAIPTEGAQVSLPADAAPHNSLTEWWYYTGHLEVADGRKFGFEYVFFQSTRARQPTGYAAHFAITDRARQEFRFAERTEALPAGSPLPTSFDLTVGDWRMFAENDGERLQAAMPGYAIDLFLRDLKPPALQQGTGLIDFGPAGSSFYYSRTRIEVTGTLTVDGEPLAVTGLAWMDHQWGDFLVLGGQGGGWDWFSFQFDDGRDLMISLLRRADGSWFLPYATLVEVDGRTVDLPSEAFSVEVLDHWTSPATGTVYPSRWRVRVPEYGIDFIATPTIPDQELLTTESTAVIYWEGEVLVEGTAGDRPLTGLGYVELTGYSTGRPPVS